MWTALSILGLAYVQNISFAVVSRARNRDNFTYHLLAATLSNLLWFLTFRELVRAEMDWILLIPYTAGTVAGSLSGTRLSMQIERWLGASSDGHLKKKDLSISPTRS